MAVMSKIPETLAELGVVQAATWVKANTDWLKAVIDKHKDLMKSQAVEKYQLAYDGYIESVDKREKARGDDTNNKLFVNLAQLVIDTAVDYLISKPPVWSVEDNTQEDKDTEEAPIVKEYRKELLAILNTEEARLVLAEQLRQGSVAGFSVVIAWVDEKGDIKFSDFPIQETIPVFDARGNLRMLIRHYELEDDLDKAANTITKVEIYDTRYVTYLTTNENGDEFILDPDEVATGNPIEHKAGRIPVSIFINGSPSNYKERIKRAGVSDLANGVFSLMEAHSHALSDKANLVEYLQDQYLLLKGVDVDEKGVQNMRKARAIALKSKESDASFIAQSQEDKCVENYISRLEDTIHTVTFTPKLNKLEGATATEIKMKYASLDIKAGKKEVYFVVAIKQLVRVLTDFLNAKKLGRGLYGTEDMDLEDNENLYNPDWLTFTLTRNLPQNYKEISSIVAELSGKVPDAYLLELLWFVDDPVKALEELKQQREEERKANMEVLGYGGEFNDVNSNKDGDTQE